VLQAGGDPITVWLTQPLFYFEPPMIVVRRHWEGIREVVAASGPNTAIYVSGHSGPFAPSPRLPSATTRANRTTPRDVRIKVYEDNEHAVMTYRGRGLELEIPTLATPSWYA
jgi:hypothetical protein